MSKLSKLKQEAYLAGKKRDWKAAIGVYQQILELDKNNPTLINELGDLFLKLGIINQSIEHFLNAAAKYRHTGLQNNAVAIYKKILRHDAENLNAHWYLSEIRANQGLTVDGEAHARQFLGASESIPIEIKELHLKRCVQVLNLYQSSLPIMEQLQGVFGFWKMEMERARAACLAACLKHDAGDAETATTEIEAILADHPEITNYTEYQQWRKRTGEAGATTGFDEDVNALSLEEPSIEECPVEEPVRNGAPAASVSAETAPAAEPAAEIPAVEVGNTSDDLDPKADLGDIPPGRTEQQEVIDNPSGSEGVGPSELPPVPGNSAPLAADSPPSAEEDDGCFSIDPDDTPSFAEIIADVADAPAEGEAESPAAAPDPSPDGPEEEIDLLAAILDDDSGLDDAVAAEGQVDTIAQEIGAQVGGDEEDSAQLYDMGMVYLEMGLLEQACECFEKAAVSPDFSVRSYEMWGITLQRAGRPADAIPVLGRGIELDVDNPQERLGLLYQQGRAYEEMSETDQARRCYEAVHEVSEQFLDVAERLTSLVG